MLYSSKFHCELKCIESYWCRAKWDTRESCGFELASVSIVSILGFYVQSGAAYSFFRCLEGVLVGRRSAEAAVGGNANASYADSNLELVNKVEGDTLGSRELSALFVILL